MNPLNIAHRGAFAYAPENTMSAFRLAVEMGACGLEFDVQLSKDGIPVVIHDERLDRTAGAQGYVCEYTWKELRSLDVGQWMGDRWKGERIPSLEEVLAEFSGFFLNVELKNAVVPYGGLEEKVIRLMDRYCDSGNVIVSSFNHESVKRIKELAPHVRTGVLYTKEPERVIDYVQSLNADAVHPHYRVVTADKISDFHAAGLLVNTWTVNRRGDMQRLVQMGIDGIITNYPDRVTDAIGEYKQIYKK
ncbi:glycerophosphodiester phosphodiesterase [Effusibacillus pohliae]|uniref:glycerophosphodiester phosphodiesterase n=1 Tax=Effusibacillus pohliae TaxID=232270 RepID=UPI000373C095|nr:glycerophosphodiester phosphodiesterase [Effusibacillus pohliae]